MLTRKAFVIIEHNMKAVMDLCERIVVSGYGEIEVVFGISLGVVESEVVCVVGPRSGKS